MVTCRQYGFSPRLAHALTRRGISRAKLGEIDQGIADYREGLLMRRHSGVVMGTQEWTIALAELLLAVDSTASPLSVPDDGDRLARGTGNGRALAGCQDHRGVIP